MKEKYLPIGTVVLLKNGTKKIMITGYLPVAKDENKTVYDYSACLFPEGIISVNQTAVFNHDQIAEVIQEGYANEETENFMGVLKDYVAKNSQTQETNTETKEVETLDSPAQKEQPVDISAENLLEEEVAPANVEMPSSTPVEKEQPTPTPETTPQTTPATTAETTPQIEPETTPQVPMMEETPVDPSTIQGANGASPMGVDDIKPFSE